MISKGGVSYKESAYHRECFVCQRCDRLLAGEKFVTRDEKPYCSDCFNDCFAKKCYLCKKAISG